MLTWITVCYVEKKSSVKKNHDAYNWILISLFSKEIDTAQLNFLKTGFNSNAKFDNRLLKKLDTLCFPMNHTFEYEQSKSLFSVIFCERDGIDQFVSI